MGAEDEGLKPDRYAVIVGISKYNDKDLKLKYADRDAEELYKLIQRRSCGNFPAKNIVKLVNENATYAEIRRAMRTFLKKPKENDLVLIYFACHGSSDPGKVENAYLLPYDTDPEDIASTGFPMDDINNCLISTLRAEKVVVIIDACHSASVGGRNSGTRGAVAGLAAKMNPYLERLSEAKPGTAMITSARENQLSYEDEKWGNDKWGKGHGVFTYHLLDGLAGAAPVDENGYVTIKAVFDYIYDKVNRDTEGKQNPVLQGKYSPNLPMAYAEDIARDEHYKLGGCLLELGQALGDKGLLKAANYELEQSIKLIEEFEGKGTFHQGRCDFSRSLIALGSYNEAIRVLEDASPIKDDKVSPDIHFYLGIAKARCWDYEGAINNFRSFLDQAPDEENSIWVAKYLDYLGGRRKVKKRALLIGVNDLSTGNLKGVKSPSFEGSRRNDVELLSDLMLEKFGFQSTSVQKLTGNSVTKQSVDLQFGILKRDSKEDDEVVIYISAPTFFAEQDGVSADETCLLMFNSEINDEKVTNAITISELHKLITEIKSRNKTLIIDAEPEPIVKGFPTEGLNYNLLLGASQGEHYHIFRAANGLTYSYFTFQFANILPTLPPHELTFGKLVVALSQKVKNEKSIIKQTPFLISGNESAELFGGIDFYQTLFDFSSQKNYDTLYDFDLERIERILATINFKVPKVRYSLGRAHISKRKYVEALNELQTVLDQSKQIDPEFSCWMGICQMGLHRYAEAIQNLGKYNDMLSKGKIKENLTSIISLIENGTKNHEKHALLVGIDDYKGITSLTESKTSVEPLKGAKNDIAALKHILTGKFKFEKKNIDELTDSLVTDTSLKQKFALLVKKAKDGHLALFHFSGYGLITKDDAYILGPYGLEDSIRLKELSDISDREGYAALISIIDARWIVDDSFSKSFDESWKTILKKIGQISLFSSPLQTMGENEAIQGESEFLSLTNPTVKVHHGVLSYHFMKRLNEITNPRITYSQILNEISGDVAPTPLVFGQNLENPIFGNFMLEKDILSSLERLFIEDIADKTMAILGKANDRKNDINPEGHLVMGIALGASGQLKQAILELEKAIRQREDKFPEASYHLGRIRYEANEDFFSAISDLHKAKEANFYAAYYYLAQAKRALIGRVTDNEIERLYRKYLDNGAPIGHREEVQAFLDMARRS